MVIDNFADFKSVVQLYNCYMTDKYIYTFIKLNVVFFRDIQKQNKSN